MYLSDLRKLSDAELITEASALIYSKELWSTGFILDAKPNEEFRQLREIIDELHWRHVVKKLSTVRQPVQLAREGPEPAS